MGLRINQNTAAFNAYRNLTATDTQMSKSLEKLSSGYRINRAADDAAGLSISENLRSKVGGFKVAQGRVAIKLYASNPSTFLEKGRYLRKVEVPVAAGMSGSWNAGLVPAPPITAIARFP